jgi:hypothetical protein
MTIIEAKELLKESYAPLSREARAEYNAILDAVAEYPEEAAWAIAALREKLRERGR